MSSLKFMNDPDVTPEDAAKIINALAKAGVRPQLIEAAARNLVAVGRSDICVGNSWAAVSITGAGSDSVVQMAEFAIPDDMMGANSSLFILPCFAWTNNANNKIYDVAIGQTFATRVSVFTRTRSNNTAEVPIIELCNRGVRNSQILPLAANANYGVNNSSAAETRTIDFGMSGMKVFITGQLAVTTDVFTLNGCSVVIRNPGR